MGLKGLKFIAASAKQTVVVCFFASAASATAETQRIEIYSGVNPSVIAPEDNTLIWVDPDGPGGVAGKCVDGLLAELECREFDTNKIGKQMNETLQAAPGGAVGRPAPDEDNDGRPDDDSKTLHAIVYRSWDDNMLGRFEPIYKSIKLPPDWKYDPRGTVHHETGHAFVNKYLGTRTCNGSAQSPCTRSLLEHWGVDEGIAKIFQSSVGGDYVPSPPANSVDTIFDDHCKLNKYPDGGWKCAHAVGNLVHDMFEELAKHKGESYARARYMDAVVALRGDNSVSVDDFHLQVGREIANSEDVQFPLDEAAALTAGDFSLVDLRRLLELLGVRRRGGDDDPEYIPH